MKPLVRDRDLPTRGTFGNARPRDEGGAGEVWTASGSGGVVVQMFLRVGLGVLSLSASLLATAGAAVQVKGYGIHLDVPAGWHGRVYKRRVPRSFRRRPVRSGRSTAMTQPSVPNAVSAMAMY